MHRRVGHGGRSLVFRASVVVAVGVVVAGGCASGERAEREREIAAVRSQLDELKKSQEANAKELARLSGEMKALDAQSAFLVGEVKAAAEERAHVKAALEQGDKAVRELTASVEELRKATPSAGPPATTAPAPQSSAPDASPEQMYAAALASLQADEHERAVAQFTLLTKKFPEHPLASSAQYWIGEAYYRQREFQQALDEFRKVIDGYPKSPQIPEALLKIGLCYRSLRDQARAREAWEQVTQQFPGTNAADQARSLLAALSEGTEHPTR